MYSNDMRQVILILISLRKMTKQRHPGADSRTMQTLMAIRARMTSARAREALNPKYYVSYRYDKSCKPD